MRAFANAAFVLLLTAWVGSLWGIGYLAVPTLFSSLPDRQLAGQIAGRMFEWGGWLGLFCGLYLLAFMIARQGARALKGANFWLCLLMLSVNAASLFGIQPLMAQLKLEAFPKDVMESLLRDRFVAWHGASSILYLLQSLLGATLVINAAKSLK